MIGRRYEREAELPGEEFLVMAEKPKLILPLRLSDGVFDPVSREAIWNGCHALSGSISFCVDFEAMDVSFTPLRTFDCVFQGVVTVKVDVKGITLSGFYDDPWALADVSLSGKTLAANTSDMKKYRPLTPSTLSVPDAVVLWEREFKENIQAQIRKRIASLEHDLVESKEYLNRIYQKVSEPPHS